MKKRRSNKKAQTWISDYTISLILFILIVILSVKIIVNSFSTNTAFEELKTDASKISETLLSEGYPPDWTNASVIRPGVLTSKRLNSTKVVNAMNMSYSALKPKFQTEYDFLVIFEDPGSKDPSSDMIEFSDLCVIGSPDVNINKTGVDCHNPVFTSISYDNMVKLTRLVIHDTEIIRMVVYAWD